MDAETILTLGSHYIRQQHSIHAQTDVITDTIPRNSILKRRTLQQYITSSRNILQKPANDPKFIVISWRYDHYLTLNSSVKIRVRNLVVQH